MEIREEMQEDFYTALQNDDLCALHTLYSRLRILNRNTLGVQTECVDISDLAENVSLAADILLRDSGKAVVFCGNDVSPIFGNRRFLTKALLEAVSNACIYGKNSLITVKTTEYESLVCVEVQSGGSFIFSGGEGLEFMRRTAKKFGGKMLIISQSEYSSVLFILKKAPGLPPEPNTCFVDLVTDRLSPVFIELYGV